MMVAYFEIPLASEVPVAQMPENAVGGLWDCEFNKWLQEWYTSNNEMYNAADEVGRSGFAFCVLDSSGEYVEESGL